MTDKRDNLYLLRLATKNAGVWWLRPDGRGQTNDVLLAGVFEHAEAEALAIQDERFELKLLAAAGDVPGTLAGVVSTEVRRSRGAIEWAASMGYISAGSPARFGPHPEDPVLERQLATPRGAAEYHRMVANLGPQRDPQRLELFHQQWRSLYLGLGGEAGQDAKLTAGQALVLLEGFGFRLPLPEPTCAICERPGGDGFHDGDRWVHQACFDEEGSGDEPRSADEIAEPWEDVEGTAMAKVTTDESANGSSGLALPYGYARDDDGRLWAVLSRDERRRANGVAIVNGTPERVLHGPLLDMRTDNDCMRCCLAMVTGLPYEDVPDFVHEHPLAEVPSVMARWFDACGWSMVEVHATDDGEIMPTTFGAPGGLWIGGGSTLRGTMHATVWRGTEMVHDPHPSRAGLDTLTTATMLWPKIQHERTIELLGQAFADLVVQVRRLRRKPCPTMQFGFTETELRAAMVRELEELVDAEDPKARRGESGDVLGIGVNLAHAVAGDDGVLAVVQGVAGKLKFRNDHIEAGGTWVSAKELERQQQRV